MTETPEEFAPLIEDPLAWQATIDASGLGPNMRGSARFWRTVQAKLGRRVSYNGAPEFTELVIELEPGVGLCLWTEEGWQEDATPNMRYGFVALEDET